MRNYDKALAALRQTTSRIGDVATFSGLTDKEVADLARAHSIPLTGRA